METKAEVWIPLTQGKVAVIDFDDFEKVRGMKWYAMKVERNFYAVRNVSKTDGKRAPLCLHRFLTNCPSEMDVNHKNGDGLNCKQENMQVCTPQQHAFAHKRKRKGASSKYRGVSWAKRDKGWYAKITHRGERIFLGRFEVEEDAAHAYDVKAFELRPEFAVLNFPDQKQCQSLINSGGAA